MRPQQLRIQYASDLHLEMIEPERFNPESILVPYGTLLALCGDIGYPEHPNLRRFLQWCSQHFEAVYWVPGNHEYYNQHGRPGLCVAQKQQLMHSLTLEFPNVFLLSRTAMNLQGTNLRILGCTLWTEIQPIFKTQVKRYMNDLRAILMTPGTAFTVDDWNAWHQADVAWLQQEIQNARASGMDLIVLTHHLPTGQLIHPKYHGHPLNFCFASHLDAMIQPPIRAWLCGHSHTAKDVFLHSVACSLNPMGYPGEEDTQFSSQKAIEFTSDSHGAISFVDGETTEPYVSGGDDSDDSSLSFH